MLNYNERLSIIMKKVEEYLGENISRYSSCTGFTAFNCTDFKIDVIVENAATCSKYESCKNVDIRNNIMVVDGCVYGLPFDKSTFLFPTIVDDTWKLIFTDISETNTVTICIHD